MRQIKFRGWDKDQKEMFLPPLDIESNLGPYHLTMDGRCYVDGYFQDQLVWMQFTGLQDKNGVEIYEGDICKWRSIHNKRSTDYHTDTVEFASGYWNLSPWVHELYSCHDDIEVIGNIYENPELVV